MKLRLFFALETPPDVREAIGSVIRDLRRSGGDVKWESPDRSHCTLRFIGETDESLLPLIVAAGAHAAVGIPAVRVRYAGIGAFPALRDPRVLWIGIEERGGILARLRGLLDARLNIPGITPDEKPFHPHVTIGRVRGRHGIDDLITEVKSTTFGGHPAKLTELILIRSELRPAGSVYTTLQTFPFAHNLKSDGAGPEKTPVTA